MAQTREPVRMVGTGDKGGNRVYPTKAVNGPDIADFDVVNGCEIPSDYHDLFPNG
jgi:hypothetical protein